MGNPGARYRDTRHNVGFRVVDELGRRWGLQFVSAPAAALVARLHQPGGGVLLAKPFTYMNLSGEAVAGLWRYYRVDLVDLLVVTDDVNLPVGQLRARRTGSAGGHNGLQSIIDSLGTNEFARVRVGVGRGDPRRDLADHVLTPPAAEDREAQDEAVVRAADAVELFLAEGIDRVMTTFNTRTR